MKFVVNFTSDLTITYCLVDDPIVDIWKEQILQYTIADCCKINHYAGYSSRENIKDKIHSLYALANKINQYVTEKITIVDILQENYKEAMSSLAVMHVHFPELYYDTTYEFLYSTLSEYNDTIHWIEGVLHLLYIEDISQHSKVLSVNLDFNKNNPNKLPIPEPSYRLFNPYVNFGDLNLSYVHIGRHAQEIYFSNDLVCPKEQFVPQRLFSASVMMYFTDNFHADDCAKSKLIQDWNAFYESRGGCEYWGFDITDEKLSFGLLKIGEISDISYQGSSYPTPKTEHELNSFREIIINNKVIDWVIE